jgi:hypothetical protein
MNANHREYSQNIDRISEAICSFILYKKVPFGSERNGTYLRHLHQFISGTSEPLPRDQPQMNANHRESSQNRVRIDKAIRGILR